MPIKRSAEQCYCRIEERERESVSEVVLVPVKCSHMSGSSTCGGNVGTAGGGGTE